MPDLVPIKIVVRYGKHPKEGKLRHIHPDFNSLPEGVRDGMDWSEYVDAHGIQMHYDKKCGIHEADVENPDPTCMFAYTCVPQDFASAAVAMFADVTEIDEAECERVYNDRCHEHEPDELIDTERLNAIKAKEDAGIPLTQRDLDARDPTKPERGITVNERKTWAGFKAKAGREIVARLRKA